MLAERMRMRMRVRMLGRRVTAAGAALPEGAIESNPMLRAWIVWRQVDGRDAATAKLP